MKNIPVEGALRLKLPLTITCSYCTGSRGSIAPLRKLHSKHSWFSSERELENIEEGRGSKFLFRGSGH